MYAVLFVCLCMLCGQSASIPHETQEESTTEEHRTESSSARCPKNVVDLSFTIDENTPKYPLKYVQPPVTDEFYFKSTVVKEAWLPNTNVWLSLKRFCMYEHMGTHLDAPSHFGFGRQDIDQIPPQRLVGPGVIINVRDKVELDLNENGGISNYAVTLDDLKKYEVKYGKIPRGAIVIMNSGWGQRYPNAELMYGSNDTGITDGNVLSFNYPGFSLESSEFLLKKRRVSIIGVDTPSIDPGQNKDPSRFWWASQAYLQPNEMPILSFVGNLDNLSDNGFTIVVSPIKLKGGRGAPARVFAIFDENDDTDDSFMDDYEDETTDDDSNNSSERSEKRTIKKKKAKKETA